MKCRAYVAAGLLLWIPTSSALAQPKLTRQQMEEDVKLFAAIMRRAYAYVEDKKEHFGVDVDRIESQALKRLEQVKSSAAFADVLQEMMAGLQDGHCEIAVGHLQPPRPRVWPFSLVAVKEGVAVAALHPKAGPDGGIARGDLLCEINGRPIGDWIEETMRRVSASTPGARRHLALQRMIFTGDETVKVTLKRQRGEMATLTLRTLPPAAAASSTKFVEARILRPGVGYLRIPSFAASAEYYSAKSDAEHDKALEPIRRAIDQAFERVAETKTLVLDLRGNLGGTDLVGAYLLSHLLPQDFVYYTTQTRCSPDLKKLPGFAYLPGEKGWAAKFIWKPRSTVFTLYKGKPYTGRVIALIDEGGASVTDCVLACLVDLYPHVRTVGRPTHGTAGGPTPLAQLPHSKADVKLSVMLVWSPKGRLIEGRGTAPDVPVEWTRAEVRDGKDADLEAALREASR